MNKFDEFMNEHGWLVCTILGIINIACAATTTIRLVLINNSGL